MNKTQINQAIREATGINRDDFCDDLNAMHEAEITLSLDQRDTYWNWLARITEKGRMATAAWLTITATARQRSEAFLRTAGKWKENP